MKTLRTNPLNIWQELLHAWNYSPSGKGNSKDYISDQPTTENGSMEITDNSFATLKSGLQGNGQVIKSFHKLNHQQKVGVKPGCWTKKFTDKPYLPGSRGRFYSSTYRFINTQCKELNFGKYENYAVLLRGFELTMTNTRTGATEYVCPADFKVEVIYARLNATRTCVDCRFDIDITAEESLAQHIKDPIEYEFKIYFTALGADHQHFQDKFKKPFTRPKKIRIREAALQAV